MKRRILVPALLSVAVLAGTVSSYAQGLKPIALPKPQITGGKPLMQALAERKTTRSFSEQALSPQVLSNLLWAAFGVNRPQADRPGLGRTAPSEMNRQEIDLYVALPDGVYIYEAQPNSLKPVVAGDLRAKVGPAAAARAAVTIIYVADAEATAAQIDTGFIGQNVYLFAASEGLNAWFRSVNAQAIGDALKLPPAKRALWVQTVGYPVKK